MRALSELADRLGLVLIEDACQAHGAERDGVRAGAGGRAAAFSFYPSKNLGAAGDAGAARDERRRARYPPTCAPPPRRAREVPERGRGLHRPAGHDPGDRASAQASAPRSLDRGATRCRRLLRRCARRRRRPSPSSDRPRQQPRLASVRRPDRRPGGTGRPSRRARHRQRSPLPRAASPLSRVRVARVERGDFPVAEAIAAEGLSLPLFPGISEAATRGSRERCRGATLADAPANEAPYRLIRDVEFGDGVIVHAIHESVRLPHRRRDAHRPVRRDPGGRRRSARAARSRAIRSSAPGSRSATRSSSATA